MTNIEIDRYIHKFTEFVESNRCRKEYVDFTSKKHKDLQRFLRTTAPESWIVDAFDWNECSHIPWMSLYNKWDEIVKSMSPRPTYFMHLPYVYPTTSTPTPRTPKFNFKVWATQVKQRFKQLLWRKKFIKVKFYTFRSKGRCEMCDAKTSCQDYKCPCNDNEQLKFKNKKK